LAEIRGRAIFELRLMSGRLPIRCLAITGKGEVAVDSIVPGGSVSLSL
jgi:hypothetical protein